MASLSIAPQADASDNMLPASLAVSGKANVALRTPEDFFAAAAALIPQLEQNAAAAEKLRRLPDENIRVLIDSGVLEVFRPSLYGGAELGYDVMMKICAILARGCTATAWVAMVYMMHYWFLAMLPREGQDIVFGSGDAIASPGVFNTIGAKARRVEGGYMLSGRWKFASGAPHSNWACLSGKVEEAGAEPQALQFVVPRKDYDVEDSWYCIGLRATGSADIVIEDEVFVPSELTSDMALLAQGTSPGAALHEGLAYKLPCVPAFNIGAASPAIGLTRGAIALFKNKIRTRVRAFTAAKQSESPAAMMRLGTAVIELDAAEGLLERAIAELEEAVRSGEGVDTELRARMRMVSAHVPAVCKAVVTSIVEASGASAMFDDSPLGRALRDVSTICTHHTLDYDGGPENYGRVLMGLAPSNPMT